MILHPKFNKSWRKQPDARCKMDAGAMAAFPWRVSSMVNLLAQEKTAKKAS
ncbi:hypothetical protein [Rufibacter tibetensis]|uniref:hypothetical protein n=1 Tax=Rufibacter tibetensis TaxID=512763 RepID=UPI000AF911DA|nr:hypothetical protein [Rufibacter tibetensis]